MYRSILESIGFEMRNNLNAIESGTGVKITSLRAMGGGTRSMLWRQIMADTTGIEITVCAEDEISALGASVLAMAAIGAHEPVVDGVPNVAASAKAMARFGDVIEPDMEMHKRYQEVAAVQQKLYPQLKETFEELHQIAERYPSTKPESPKAEI